MRLTTRKSKLFQMVGGSSGQVLNVPKRCRESIETLRTCPELPPTIWDNFDYRVFRLIFDNFDSIFRFRPKCLWLTQLRRHRQCRWRRCIARFMFWDTLGSPQGHGRCGLVLTFLRPFLATLIFGFLGTFLENLTPSSDFSRNAADCFIFAATGNADGDDVSPDLCSEVF